LGRLLEASFETAVRLKESGFPQPTPEAGQFWYNPNGILFVVYLVHEIVELYEIGRRNPSIGHYWEDWTFAPTATDILRELGPLFDLSYDCAEFWCGDKKGWNPAEAAAEAWIKLNPKIKEDFIRQTEEE